MDFEMVRCAIAAVAQREFEDSLTWDSRVADRDYLGDRVAAGLLGRSPGWPPRSG
jgi:hypothetical protein